MILTIVCSMCRKSFTYDHKHGSKRTICDDPSCKQRRQDKYDRLRLSRTDDTDIVPTETTCMLVMMYYLEGHTDVEYLASELGRTPKQIEQIISHCKNTGLIHHFHDMFLKGMFAKRYRRAKELIDCAQTLNS